MGGVGIREPHRKGWGEPRQVLVRGSDPKEERKTPHLPDLSLVPKALRLGDGPWAICLSSPPHSTQHPQLFSPVTTA